jgi:hypothetical protein
MTWQRPYSVKRLLCMIRAHNFGAEHDYDGNDETTGEPLVCRAYRRVKAALAQRREQRDANYDPMFDEEMAEFHVCDVAILREELRHLAHLERKLMLAVGPPTRTLQYNRKTKKLDDMGPSDCFGE